MKEYRLLEDYSAKSLGNRVNSHLMSGWELYGNTFTVVTKEDGLDRVVFYQPVIKDKDTAPEELVVPELGL